MEKIVVFLSTKQHLVLTKENLPENAKTASQLMGILESWEFVIFYRVIEKVDNNQDVIRTDHIVNTSHIVDVVIQ